MYHQEYEYEHGYVKGLLHGQPIPRISPETARLVNSENIYIAINFAHTEDYWRGYSHGLIGFGARQAFRVGAVK